MKKPKITKDEGWMKESDPVICLISYTKEDEFNGTSEQKTGYCVCTWVEFPKTKKKYFQPVTEHLWASTMPSADYHIQEEDNFKVLKWDYINLEK